MFEKPSNRLSDSLPPQASIEVREAGKRAVTTIQQNSAHSPNFSAAKRFDEMVNPESRMDDSRNLGYSVYSRRNTPQHKAQDGITILHFNDVYNVESNTQTEPIGGAARFLTAMRSLEEEWNPLVLFSGDAFSPSMLSFFTQGEEMIPVLNSIGTKCAVFGNHDFGEEETAQFALI